MGNSKKLEEAVDTLIQELHKRVGDQIDVGSLDGLEVTMQRIQEKVTSGQLSLKDLRDFLLLYRNILVPAAMKQEIDRLAAIKDIVKAIQ